MNSENIQKIIKEFEENFMNNGVSGLLKNEFQEPKMLIIKSFLLSSLQHIRQETLEEIELDIEKLKKYHKEFECGGLYEDFCEDQNCENAPKEYNQAINDVIDFIQSKK